MVDMPIFWAGSDLARIEFRRCQDDWPWRWKSFSGSYKATEMAVELSLRMVVPFSRERSGIWVVGHRQSRLVFVGTFFVIASSPLVPDWT